MTFGLKGCAHILEQVAKALYKRVPDTGKTFLKTSWLTLRRAAFKLPYMVSYVRAALVRKDVTEDAFDVLYVMDFHDEDWILGAICRRIAKESKGRIGYYHHRHFYSSGDRDPFWPVVPKLPDAKNYFFADAPFLAWCLKSHPPLWHRKTFAYDTHPRERISDRELVFALNQATHTISMCSAHRNELISKGLRPERVTTIIGGADKDVFTAHDRSPDGLIGFCANYYPRKNPDRIIEIVERMPHRNFVLLAGSKKWQDYPRFQHLKNLPNLEYVETTYDRYPEYYGKMTVFASVSLVEGGPIPLLEAMMSNVAPVASRTGFGEDVIRHGENGYLFDPYAPTDEVCELIEKGFSLKTDVRSTVFRHTWQEFAREVNRKFDRSESYPQIPEEIPS
jgi:glycosyltransferase involved in cell wall biosynthesis